jgi:YebC/PmpR family DNA-binding regulatory protein
MSGHSHWSTIQRKKGVNDAKRAQIFTRLAKEIAVSAREGGSNIEFNPRLRLAVQKAKDGGMPKDNIDRAIKKVTSGDGANFKEIWYEGYGPGGAAVLVEALTDNLNRTSNNVRSTFSRQGGNLGGDGSVNWLFDRQGLVLIKGTEEQLEDLSLAVIDMGALDVGEPSDGLLEVYTEFEFMEQLRKDLVKMGAEVVSSEISMQPKSTVDLDSKTAQLNLELLDKLDDLDDVHHVYTNGNFPDELSTNKGA